MPEENVTERDVQQIDELHRQLTEQAATKELKIDICAAWRVIKPYWPLILKFVRHIPKVGEKIAAVLEFLGQYLDKHCGT